MSADCVVGTWRRSPSGEVRATLKTFKGRQYVDVRHWYAPDNSGERRPSKKGITVPVEDLDELRAAIDEAQRHLADEPPAAV